MFWRTLPPALALLLTACAATQPVRVREPMLPCNDAMRVARETVMRLGYSISSVRMATPETPGVVVGTRETGWDPATPVAGEQLTLTITVTCSDAGAELEGVTNEDFMARRSFPRRFKTAVEQRLAVKPVAPRSAREEAPQQGLVVRLEPQRGRTVQAEFGSNLLGAGIMPVRLEIINLTPRRYDFRRAEVLLETVEGRRESALPLAEATARLAALPESGGAEKNLRDKELHDGEIAPGASLTGYLYFKATTYRRARVVLTDIEAEEPEGFSINF